MRETRVQSLGWEDPLEKEMATHSSTLAWKIPWTEEPGRLQSMGSQRVRHDWATSLLPLRMKAINKKQEYKHPTTGIEVRLFGMIFLSLLEWFLSIIWWTFQFILRVSWRRRGSHFLCTLPLCDHVTQLFSPAHKGCQLLFLHVFQVLVLSAKCSEGLNLKH